MHLLLFIFITSIACMSRERILFNLNQTREIFNHGYNSYLSIAYPADEIRPISCQPLFRSPKQPTYINDVLGNYMLTLIDSMDMLAIMGDSKGFQHALDLLKPLIHFEAVKVQVFESTIRVMGGLLSCHAMATLPKFNLSLRYDGHCLKLAKTLGDALLPAFKHTMPFARVNLVTGIDYNDSGFTCAAGVGTLLLEFGTLSRMTGDGKYELAARRALDRLWGMRSEKDLVGIYLDVISRQWTSNMTGIGGGVDSLYEYMLKSYILFGEGDLMDMFAAGYTAVQKYVANGIVYGTSNLRGDKVDTVVESLSAFWPGMQVLIGDLESAIRFHQYLFTVWRKYGLLPESFDAHAKIVMQSNYPLRPELFESTFYLYQATKNHYYLEVGASLLRDISTMRVKCGFASIENVFTGAKTDRMESFFLSETLKYLYLLFDVDDDNWVFSTEGHYMHIPYRKHSHNRPTHYSSQCKHYPTPPSHLFGGGHIALPLPINELEKIYEMVDVIPQHDHFYTHVVQRINNGTYTGDSNDAFCYARSMIKRISVVVPFTTKSAFKVVKGRCFLRGISGLILGMMQSGDDWRIVTINESACDGNVQLEYNSVKEWLSGTVLHEPDLHKSVINVDGKTFYGYTASFGPVIRNPATFRVTLSKLPSGKLSHGCIDSDYKLTVDSFAVIKRGVCTFAEKAIVAQRMKAKGLIIGNTQNKVFLMTSSRGDATQSITIPVLLMPLDDALRFIKIVTSRGHVSIGGATVVERVQQVVSVMGRRVNNLVVVDGEEDNALRGSWKG